MTKLALSDEILLSVQQPARYIGGEVNMVKKDLDKMAAKFAICFPDAYEIGMSHLGIQMDEKLVANTRNIDVILGGHSHTFMEGPKNYLNIDGKNVPVMHTGKNGIYVGRLDLTLNKK